MEGARQGSSEPQQVPKNYGGIIADIHLTHASPISVSDDRVIFRPFREFSLITFAE